MGWCIMKLQILCPLVFLAFLINLFADDRVIFHPGFQVGSKLTLMEKAEVIMPMMGQEVKNTVVTKSSIAVSSEEDDQKKVSYKTEKLLVTMKAGNQTFEYDSEDETNQSPILKMSLAQFPKMDLSAVFNDKNEFVKVVQSEDDSSPLSEEQVKDTLNALIDHGFPQGEVSVGQTWEHEQELSLGEMGKASTKFNYTYVGMHERNQVSLPRVDFEGNLQGDIDAAGAATVTLSASKVKGWLLFDNSLGIATYSETQVEAEMTIGVGAEGAAMDLKSTSTFEVLDSSLEN